MLDLWPDVGIRSSLKFPKVAQKVVTVFFNLKRQIFKVSPKVSKHLGYFWKFFQPRLFKNHSIWSHCNVSKGQKEPKLESEILLLNYRSSSSLVRLKKKGYQGADLLSTLRRDMINFHQTMSWHFWPSWSSSSGSKLRHNRRFISNCNSTDC